MSEKAIERLAGQVTTIADDWAPATLETDHVFHGIEQQFDMFSDLLDRRQSEATDHGQAVLRELGRRLEEFGGQIDARGLAAAAKSAGIMNAIDARFEELARRLESRAQTPVSDPAIAHLEITAGGHFLTTRKFQRPGGER